MSRWWVMQLDTFSDEAFPLYGPIDREEDARRIANAAQQEIIASGHASSWDLTDRVTVWTDARKRSAFGDHPALYTIDPA